MSKPLVWPHESNKISPLGKIFKYLISSAKIRAFVGKFLMNSVSIYILGGKDPYPKLHEEIMAFVNGKKAALLANKYRFIETVSEMKKGYLVPHQILISPHSQQTPKVLSIISLWKAAKIYCKPLTGDNARGVKAISESQIPKILASLKEDYIFQEALPFRKEFRWAISHGKDGTIKRFCYEKIRPTIKGNGKTPFVWLILKDENMTLRSKLVNLLRKFKELLKIVPKDEEYLLTHSANPPAGSYEKVVTDSEIIKDLDKFMLNLIQDLEEYIKTKNLPLLCFDIGIIKPEVLSKESIVPLECQMPFSALAYFMKYKHSITRFLDFYSSVLP